MTVATKGQSGNKYSVWDRLQKKVLGGRSVEQEGEDDRNSRGRWKRSSGTRKDKNNWITPEKEENQRGTK